MSNGRYARVVALNADQEAIVFESGDREAEKAQISISLFAAGLGEKHVHARVSRHKPISGCGKKDYRTRQDGASAIFL